MKIDVTETMTAQVTTTGESGETIHLATLSASYRAGKRMAMSMDLADAYNKDAHAQTVSADLRDFMAAVWERCKKADLPVPADQ